MLFLKQIFQKFYGSDFCWKFFSTNYSWIWEIFICTLQVSNLVLIVINIISHLLTKGEVISQTKTLMYWKTNQYCSFVVTHLKRNPYALATIVRTLWLAAEQARFPCKEQTLSARCSRHIYSLCLTW